MTASPEVVSAAKMYCDHGFAIVPVMADKKPFGKRWQLGVDRDEVLRRLHGPDCVAIGFLGGSLNHNIVPLDFDSDDGEAWWQSHCEAAGIAPDDFPTVITPGKIKEGKRTPGRHRYVTDTRGVLTNVEGALKLLGINVRGKGHAMLPPSPHPDGGIYRWVERHSLNDFDIVPACPDFIYDAIATRPRSEEHHPTNGKHPPVSSDMRIERYVAAALISQCNLVRTAPVGQRNAMLNNAALSMGHQVAAGRIGRRQVEAALLEAASVCGLLGEDGEQACRATIKSGLDKGEAEPAEPLKDDQARQVPTVVRASHVQTAEAKAPPLPLFLRDIADMPDSVAPRGWLLGNVFCRRFCSSLLADGGVGKTALRIAQLLSLASGRALTGEFIFQRCRVILISLEDDTEELDRRLMAAMKYHGVTKSEVAGWLFTVAPGGAAGKLMTSDARGNLSPGDMGSLLEQAIVEIGADVVAMDPFVKTHGAKENDNTAMDAAVQILSSLAAKYNIAIDTPHHTSKGIADPGNADRGRGASSAKDAWRLVYTLTPMTRDEAKELGIGEELRRSLIRMDSAKVNIAPPMSEARWFRLIGVPLGNQTAMYPSGDNVQTVEAWTPPGMFEDISNFLANQILDALDAGLPNGDPYTNENKASVRAACDVVIRFCPTKTKDQARAIVGTWIRNGVLSVEETKLANRKVQNGLRVNPQKRPD